MTLIPNGLVQIQVLGVFQFCLTQSGLKWKGLHSTGEKIFLPSGSLSSSGLCRHQSWFEY